MTSTERRPSFVVPLLGLVFAAIVPLLLVRAYHFTHDRSGNYVAHDFAEALLRNLAPHAVLFTNGDNDTFPLWYAQEVEKIRTDVRVVNLSLLNTPWYVRQVRDLEPRVPLTLTDAEVDGLQAYRDETGQIVMPNAVAVASIIQACRGKRPVYFAFSVPEAQAYEQYLVRGALSYRVMDTPVPADQAVDLAAIERELASLKIRGMFTEDGSLDSTVYRDEVTYTFLQNGIAMAHFEVGLAARTSQNTEKAVHAMLEAGRVAPQLPFFTIWAGRTMEEAGQIARAESLYRSGMARYPSAYEFPWRLGLMQLTTGQDSAGFATLESAAGMPGASFEPSRDLIAQYIQRGDAGRATEVVSRWLARNPGDTTAQQIYELLRATTSAPATP